MCVVWLSFHKKASLCRSLEGRIQWEAENVSNEQLPEAEESGDRKWEILYWVCLRLLCGCVILRTWTSGTREADQWFPDMSTSELKLPVELRLILRWLENREISPDHLDGPSVNTGPTLWNREAEEKAGVMWWEKHSTAGQLGRWEEGSHTKHAGGPQEEDQRRKQVPRIGLPPQVFWACCTKDTGYLCVQFTACQAQRFRCRGRERERNGEVGGRERINSGYSPIPFVV